MAEYVHYGSQYFDRERFVPVKNGRNFLPKPAGRTGLWASRVGDENGWETWCRYNRFKTESLEVSFRFTMPNDGVLTLKEPEDLLPLPKIYQWDYDLFMNEPEMAEFDFLKGIVLQWCYLDYEALAEEYDAIELINSKLFYNALYSWDCNCLLVLKAEKLTEMPF